MPRLVFTVFLCALCVSVVNVCPVAAGDLNPPAGPITPTQRTPINANTTPGDADSLFKITTPGSYYLTANIAGVAAKHGIEIAASGVTLDLNGFELAGVPSSLDAITSTTSSLTSAAIINGSIRNWGGAGVNLGGANPVEGCVLRDLRSSGNSGAGIVVGAGSTITNCTAQGNAVNGITTGRACSLSNCTAYKNSAIGIEAAIGCTLNHCTASTNTSHDISADLGCNITHCAASLSTAGRGISAAARCLITDCTATDNALNGIFASSGSTITNCTASSNFQHGIEVSSDCSVTGCTSESNGFDGIRALSSCRITNNTCDQNGFAGLFSGIFAQSSNNHIEGNHTSNNDAGISINAAATGNCIIHNYASGSGANNYIFPASGNFVGTVTGTSAAMNGAANSNINISN